MAHPTTTGLVCSENSWPPIAFDLFLWSEPWSMNRFSVHLLQNGSGGRCPQTPCWRISRPPCRDDPNSGGHTMRSQALWLERMPIQAEARGVSTSSGSYCPFIWLIWIRVGPSIGGVITNNKYSLLIGLEIENLLEKKKEMLEHINQLDRRESVCCPLGITLIV